MLLFMKNSIRSQFICSKILMKAAGNNMDMEKYAMLKAIVPLKDEITIGIIKDELNVDSEEALEMINNLSREGLIELFAYDGTHFRVIK